LSSNPNVPAKPTTSPVSLISDMFLHELCSVVVSTYLTHLLAGFCMGPC
jgi:hypothetical protein